MMKACCLSYRAAPELLRIYTSCRLVMKQQVRSPVDAALRNETLRLPVFFFSFLFFFTPRDENRADRPNGKSHQARGRLLSSGRALQQPLEQKNDINTYNGRNPSRPLIPNTTKKKLIELLFQAALSFFPSSITLSGFLQNSQLC